MSMLPWVIFVEVFAVFFVIALPSDDVDFGFVKFCLAIVAVVTAVVYGAIVLGSKSKA